MKHVTRPTGLRSVAIGLATALTLVACGQKPGVHVEGGNLGGVAAPGTTTGGTTATTGTVAGDTGTTGDATAETTGGGTTTGGTTTGGGTTGGGTTGGGGGGSAATTGGGGSTGGGGGSAATTGGGGGAQPQGRDMTGVAGDVITIGLHAPVSGAAPVPAEEFRDNQNLYWDYMESKGVKFMNRRVTVAFEDDQYNRGTAQQKCSQLVDKAFLLIGGAGTDQIQACGQLANSREVPYFSAGVTEVGLRGLPWYFAASMSYAQQADLLAKYIKRNFGGEKVAMVVTNTPNFQDAWESFEQAASANGLDYYKTLKHEKGDQTWYSSFSIELQQNGVGVVYPLTAPTDWIGFASAASNQGYDPQWAGVGITMGLNKIISTGCNSASNMDGARFFSPYPELDVVDSLDPEFRKATSEFGVEPTDIGLTLWGINKTIAQFLKRYEETYGAGANLTREDFRAVTETAQGISTNLFPTLSYSAQNHFGASEVHVLEADCSQGQYKTLETFKSTF